MSTKFLVGLILTLALVPNVSQAEWHSYTGLEFRFHRPVDYHNWHRGGWHHGWHDNRLGWWWVVAGSWYFFNRPVYPYPSADVPPVIIEQEPEVMVVSPPVTVPAYVPPPAPVASVQTWYYCKSTNSYYPYVSSCGEGWMQVAATPASP
jgi:hypothetical protein